MKLIGALFITVATSSAQMCKHAPSYSTLDCLYAPGQWPVDGGTPQQMEDRYFKTIAKSEEKMKKIVQRTTTPYGEDEREVFDIYGPTSAASVLIFVHGGYWQTPSFTRSGVAPLLEHLLAANTTVVTIGYKLASANRPISAITHDVAAAIQKILTLFPSATRIVVCGHSAGAQLAFKAVAQLKSARIKALVLIGGIYDLTELPGLIPGQAIGLTAADAKESSCKAEDFAKGLPLEVLILVGDHDTPIFRSQPVELHEALTEREIKSQFVQLPHEDHLSLIEGFTQAEKQQTKLLKKVCSVNSL